MSISYPGTQPNDGENIILNKNRLKNDNAAHANAKFEQKYQILWESDKNFHFPRILCP